MKHLQILIPLAALPFNIYAGTQQQHTRPNIIFVMTDDQGKNDLGCEGNPYIQTPNIDAFYKQTVRFTNYHVSTTSAPSRAHSPHGTGPA